MSKIVDAKGLACPEPVILARKALEQNEDVTVIVDDEIAGANIKRLGAKLGRNVSVEKKEEEYPTSTSPEPQKQRNSRLWKKTQILYHTKAATRPLW